MFTQHWPKTMVRLLFVFFAALVISACSSEGSVENSPPINNSVMYTLDGKPVSEKNGTYLSLKYTLAKEVACA